MFDVLVLSGAHLELKSRWVGTSLLMHVSAAALAVMVTRAALESPPAEMRDSPVMLFVPKAPEPPPPPEVKPEPAPAVVVTEPPPKGFQTVAILSDIPDVIPPVDLTERALDPRDFTGRGVEGGLATGVVGGTGKVDGWSGDRFVQWDEGGQRCIRIDVAMDTAEDRAELEEAASEWAAEQADADVSVEGDLVRLTSCN